jgi:hypothetical protein
MMVDVFIVLKKGTEGIYKPFVKQKYDAFYEGSKIALCGLI